MKTLLLTLCCAALLLTMTGPAHAAVTLTGKTVTYKAGETTLKGYLVANEALPGKRPAVLVIHEWWGQDAYARQRATMFAELGYVALAIDMYGDGQVATTPDAAGKLAGGIRKDLPTALARIQAALTLVQALPNVDPQQVVAVGYCFGGGLVLNAARAGFDLKGAVCFHGSLAPMGQPAAPGAVKAQVRVYNGANDTFVSADEIAAFKQEMTAAKVPFEFHNMAGSLHAFTNPESDELAKKFNLKIAYNEAADKESWADMKQFLGQLLKQP